MKNPPDDELNNLIAAGAVAAALSSCETVERVECVGYSEGAATNVLLVSFEFMKSRYMVTVERFPE